MCRTPAASAARTSPIASARFIAIGFSHRTCLPAAAAVEHDRGVQEIGRGDDDGVHVVALQDVLVVGEGVCGCRWSRRAFASDRRVGIAERDDLGVGAEGEAGQVVGERDPPLPMIATPMREEAEGVGLVTRRMVRQGAAFDKG